MRPLIALLALLMATGTSLAQELKDDVLVYGTVKRLSDRAPLEGAWVVVQRNGVKVAQLVTDSAGRYEVHLDYDEVYRLYYMQGGMVTKNVTIDISGIPAPVRYGGHGMSIDVTLFQAYPCLDVSALEEPIGKAHYEPADSTISWDIGYTESVRSRIADAMRRHDSLRVACGCP
jgi:hypothetical protein